MGEFIPIGIYNLYGDEIGYWVHNDKAYLVVKQIDKNSGRYYYMTPKECEAPMIVDSSKVEKVLDLLPKSRKIVLFGREYVTRRLCKNVEIVDTKRGRVSIVKDRIWIRVGKIYMDYPLTVAKDQDFGTDHIGLLGLGVNGEVKRENRKILFLMDNGNMMVRIETVNDCIHGELELRKLLDDRYVIATIRTENEEVIKEILKLGPENVQLFIGENASALLVVGDRFLKGVYDGNTAVFLDKEFRTKKVNGKIVLEDRGVTFVLKSNYNLEKVADLKLEKSSFVVEMSDGWLYIEDGKGVIVPGIEYVENASKWLRNASEILPVVLVYWNYDKYSSAIVDTGKVRFKAYVDVENGSYYDVSSEIYVLNEKGHPVRLLPDTYEELVKIISEFEKFLGKKITRVFANDWRKTVYFLEDGKTIEVNAYGVCVNGEPIAPLALKEFI